MCRRVSLPLALLLLSFFTGNAMAAEAVKRPFWASAVGQDSYGAWADLTVTRNHITAIQRFRLIPMGTFTMGTSNPAAAGSLGNTPHLVTLTQDFWLADTKCTQAMWRAVVGKNNSRIVIHGQEAVMPYDDASHIAIQGDPNSGSIPYDQQDSFMGNLNRLFPGRALDTTEPPPLTCGLWSRQNAA